MTTYLNTEFHTIANHERLQTEILYVYNEKKSITILQFIEKTNKMVHDRLFEYRTLRHSQP